MTPASELDRLFPAIPKPDPLTLNSVELSMPKYRKKPVVIDAIQFTKAMAEGHSPLPEGVHMARRSLAAGGHFPKYADELPLSNFSTCHRHFIQTLEGQMDVQIGDWVITGVKGEHYPCKPDIFAATYEPVDADETNHGPCAQGDEE